LCLSDPLAAAPFLPGARSWASRALRDNRIEVRAVSLPDDLRQRLLEAQHRQYRRHPNRVMAEEQQVAQTLTVERRNRPIGAPLM